MEYLDFEKQLAKDPMRPIYIFYGKEPFLRQEGIELVRKQLGEDVFFKEYTNSKEFSVDTLIGDLQTDALFEDLNLIILRDAGELLTKIATPLAKYLEAPNPKSVLLLELEKIDQRSKFAKIAGQKGVCVECKQLYDRPKPWLRLPPWESDLAKWVCRRATIYKKKISPQNAFNLTEHIGSNLKDLDSQLQKIALFLKDKNEISGDDIEKIVYTSKRINVFEFLDCLSAQKLPEALKQLRQIFKNGLESQDDTVFDPMQIALQLLRLTHYRMRQLWKVSISRDTSDIAEFALKKLQEFAPNFRQQQLVKIWQALLDTEHKLKQSRLDPIWAMEQLVITITSNRSA